MSFYDLLDEMIGDGDAITDIRACVRKCWLYDFEDYPIRFWEGKGRLFTTDDNEWYGSIDANDVNHIKTPSLQDGRDGSSATYNFTLTIPDLPGQSALQLYEELKADQSRVSGRDLICYLAIFREDEGLRPQTPIVFFKQLTMLPPKFSEKIVPSPAGSLIRTYEVTVPAKDGNVGRSNIPRGTYTDTIQKQRAKELGVSLDRGCEFVAGLANRTYVIQ